MLENIECPDRRPKTVEKCLCAQGLDSAKTLEEFKSILGMHEKALPKDATDVRLDIEGGATNIVFSIYYRVPTLLVDEEERTRVALKEMKAREKRRKQYDKLLKEFGPNAKKDSE